MPSRLALSLGCLGFALALATPAFGLTGEELRSIIERAERQYWGKSSTATMTMEVVTANWSRRVEMEAFSEGKEQFLARILAPARDRGVATLKSGDEIWNYLPKVDRVIKVPSSMMGEAWMGSHLTNDDLVKESKIEESYTFRLLEEKVEGGEGVWIIEAVPLPETAVVWGKVVYTIRKRDEMPLKAVYHDEEGIAVREMRFLDYKTLGGKHLPTRVEVVPFDKPGEKTVITYTKLAFDVPHPAGTFSLKSLKAK